MKDWLDKIPKYLVLILILAIALIYIFRTGAFLLFDDTAYSTYALQISIGSFNPIIHPFSYGWLFPYFVYLSGYIFGYTRYGLVLLTTTVEYLSLIILTYILALRIHRKMYGTAAGAEIYASLSALLLAIMPFILQIATRVLNDMLLGVLATLTIIFLLSDRKLDWLLAGAMAGFLIYVKLIGLAFILPFGIIALISRKRIYVMPALILSFAVYLIPFVWIAHNPFYSLQSYGTYQSNLSPSSLESNLVVLSIEMGLINALPIGNIFYEVYSYGILLLIAFAGTIIAFRRRQKYLGFMAALFWIFFLYTHFGTITLSHYSVQSFISRYLILVAAPFAILVAFTLINVYKQASSKNKIIGWCFVAAVILIYTATMWQTYSIIYYYNHLIATQNYITLYKILNAR